MSAIGETLCYYGLHAWRCVYRGQYFWHYECKRRSCPAERIEHVNL